MKRGILKIAFCLICIELILGLELLVFNNISLFKSLQSFAVEELEEETGLQTYQGFIYEINEEENTAIIIAYTENLSSISIPAQMGEYRVTEISSSAFNGNTNLISVTINQGISTIRENAFAHCTNLQNVQIPDSVTYIGKHAFYGCSNLININIPESVKNQEVDIFGDGTYLSESEASEIFEYELNSNQNSYTITKYKGSNEYVKVPRKIGNLYVTKIDSYAFSGNEGIKQVDILDGVTTIDLKAFMNSSHLTNVTIPDSVTNIGWDAFSGCSSLQEIVIPGGVETLQSNTFENCTSLRSVTISEGIKNIEDSAFKNCTLLGSVTIPKSIETIEDGAFVGCTNLKEIIVNEGNNYYESDADLGILFTKGKEKLVFYPYGKKAVYLRDYDGLKEIADYAFYGHTSLQDIYFPNGITTIGDMAFYDCTNLIKIDIPNQLKSIGRFAFGNCKKLNGIEIPEGVTTIGQNAFAGCESLQKIEIPEGITTIDDLTFNLCTSLEEVIIPSSVTKIGLYAFQGCSNLKKILIPDTVTSIGLHAFLGCDITITCKENSVAYTYAIDNEKGVLLDKVDPVCTTTYSEIVNNQITVTIEASEKIRRVDNWTLSDDKTKLTKTYSANLTETITVKDLVGNEVNIPIEVVIYDEIAPEILDVKYSTTEPTRDNIKITITVNEPVQNVDGWENLGGNNIDGYKLTREFEDNTTEPIKVIVKDIAGNEATNSPVSIEVTNIDRKPPEEIEMSSSNEDNKQVTISIIFDEEIQEVEGWELSDDKKQLIKTYTSNATETIIVKDLVGNEIKEPIQIKITNIDKEAPTATITYSETVKTNKDVTVTIELSEPVQNIEGWELSEDKKQLTKTYSANTTETIIIKDIVGNELQQEIKITNIDKTEPTIEKAKITSTKYKTDDQNKYISNIKSGTTKNEIISNITSNVDYKIMTKDNKEVTNETIATGMKLVFTTGETYEIVVTGDINGDGKISVTDLTKMKKALIGKETLEGCYKEAADVNGDSKITVTDLARVKRALVGLINL